MSLKIRMSRGGAKKRPFYRIVVADTRAPRDGRFIEKIGFHNPMMPRDHAERLSINLDRAKYWMSVGAKPSPRVHRFLADAGVMEKASIPEQTKQHLPRAKEQERIREREQKAKEAAEAAKLPRLKLPKLLLLRKQKRRKLLLPLLKKPRLKKPLLKKQLQKRPRKQRPSNPVTDCIGPEVASCRMESDRW